ncbi:MAG: GYF domain-containing protein, partial [Archangium sp.]
MNFFCNKCQRRYSIADDKVRGKTVKVRCKNCQNVISVEGPPAEAEERTRVVSLENLELLREQDRSLSEAGPASSTPRAAAANTSWDDEPTRTMPVRDTRSPWFAMVKNKQEGPLDEVALGELVASGAVTPRSYFWQQGMPDWKRAQDIPELAGLFASAAPPPAPPPPRVMAPPPKPAPVEQSATSWQPEPPPPSQTTWQSTPASSRQAPRASRASASAAASDNANGAPLGEL